ncbi:MAG: hypothetical protein Ta2A_12450 [Treponemataceae bacterium]|nr:MAG: hypothetical protein Ta2A_12450 [Treponemataceae bacterium]
MAETIRAGIKLFLESEKFNSGIKSAMTSVKQFGTDATAAAQKIDKAFSGVAGSLGAIGITVGAGATVKALIDFDERMVRIRTDIGATAEEIGKLRRRIMDVSKMPDIKMDYTQVTAAVEAMEGVDYAFINGNLENIARLMQATGMNADAAGAQFTTFYNSGRSVDEITSGLNQMIVAADIGGTNLEKYGEISKRVQASSGLLGKSLQAQVDAVKALEVAGKSMEAPKAMIAYDALLSDLADSGKQRMLKSIGIEVIDAETGNVKNFMNLMQELVSVNQNYSGNPISFSEGSLNFIRAFQAHPETVEQLKDLGDTTDALMNKSKQNAGSAAAGLRNLQTSFLAFADSNLAKPIEKLGDLLNKLAENPEMVEAGIRGITRAVAALAAIKIGAGVISFIANLKEIKGGKVDIAAPKNDSKSAMPVFVTNMGSAGISGISDGQSIGSVPSASGGKGAAAATTPQGRKINKSAVGKAGVGAAAVTAIAAVPQMIGSLIGISKNEEMTANEKGTARGGAIGEAVGTIGGAAAGAMAGAAIGSVVPVVGTALGAIVGGLIGQFGGMAGQKIGAAIGNAVTKEQMPNSVEKEMALLPHVPQNQEAVKVDGQVQFGVDVHVTDDKPKVYAYLKKNTAPDWFNTGNAFAARGGYNG